VTTRVVNLRKEPFDVYIGRAGHGQDGYFGNPYAVNHTCGRCGEFHDKPLTTLFCFKAYFEERVATDPEFRARVLSLKGKTLGCFCKPKACHGDLIVEWLNKQP
jgi:hypothetical protein